MLSPSEFIASSGQLSQDLSKINKYTGAKGLTVTYTPIRYNNKPLYISFNNLVLASSAKAPSKDYDTKYLNISFKSRTEFGDYKNIDKLKKINDEFIAAMDKLDEQFLALLVP